MKAMDQFSQSWTAVLKTARLIGGFPTDYTPPRLLWGRAAINESASPRWGRVRALLKRYPSWVWGPLPAIDLHRSVGPPGLQGASLGEADLMTARLECDPAHTEWD